MAGVGVQHGLEHVLRVGVRAETQKTMKSLNSRRESGGGGSRHRGISLRDKTAGEAP